MAVEYDEDNNVYEVPDAPVAVLPPRLPALPDTPDAVMACEAMLPEVLAMYRAIVNDKDAPPGARIAAGQAIENRALGKATQATDKPRAMPDAPLDEGSVAMLERFAEYALSKREDRVQSKGNCG